MADNTIIYRLDIDTSGTNTDQARKSLESLKRSILETEAEIAKLKAGMKAGTLTVEQAAGPLSQYETRLRALRVTYNETGRAATGLEGFTSKIGKQFKEALGPIENLLKGLGPIGANIDGLKSKFGAITSLLGQVKPAAEQGAGGLGTLATFTTKTEAAAGGASKGIGALLGGLSPVAVVAGIAGAAILEFGGELLELATKTELINKKAQVLYGDAFPKIAAAAKENANAIGLTSGEYLALASSQQQVFQALGLTADQTVDLTPRLLKLSDGLADFSAGQVNTAQAADILKAAIQGNTKGLAELGIPIRRSGDDLQRLSAEMQSTGKFTKDQADALASVQLVFDQVGGTIEKFSAGEKTLADKSDEVSARFRQQKEDLSEALTPALNAATSAVGGLIESFARMIKGDALGSQLASSSVALRLMGYSQEADAFDKVADALDQVNAKRASSVESIDKVVNQQTAEAASTDKLNEKLIQLLHSRDEFNKQGKTAFADDFQKEADIVSGVLKKRKEEQEAAAKLGLTYEALTSKLEALQSARKLLNEGDQAAIDANTKEQEAVKKRLKVFDDQTKVMSDAAKASQTYAQAQKQIAVDYAVSTAIIEESAKNAFITEAQRQRALLEIEVSTAQARLNAKEQFAKADGKITEKEKADILSLSDSVEGAKKKLNDFNLAADNTAKDREAEIKLKIALNNADLAKEVSDAIAGDELTKAFDDAFANSANNVGAELKAQILSAAKDGTIDFNGLIAGGNVPIELVEKLRTAYERFRLETERNKIELIKSQQEAELTKLKTRLEEVNTERAKLEQKKIDAQTDVSIRFTEGDENTLTNLTTEAKDLDGKVVKLSVEVDANANALTKIGEAMGNLGKPTGKKDKRSPLADLLGLNDETTQFLVDKATELGGMINDALLASQQAGIQQRLDATIKGIEDESNEKQDAVQRDLDQGLITQEQANQRRKAIDQQAEADKHAAQVKAFNEQKAIKREQALLEFGVELARLAAGAAETGIAAPIFYAVQAGVAAARLATNLSLIESATIAERGVIVRSASKGEVAQGPSHTNGGIPAIVNGQHAVELEGDEAIINRRSTAAFLPLLSYINSYQGWGVPFAGGGVVSSTPAPRFALGGITDVPQFATGGHFTRGTALVNISAPSDLEELLRMKRKESRFAFGGVVPAFADGGLSLIPSDGTIANRHQLEAVTSRSRRPVQLNGEQQDKKTVLYISQLDEVKSRADRTKSKVSFG